MDLPFHPFFGHEEEPLISVLNVSDRIKIFPYYFLHNIPGTMNDCFLRVGVVNKLLEVVKNIPIDYHLVILDGWRSYQTQQFLYHTTKKYFVEKFSTVEKAEEQLSRFVAVPSMDPKNPAPHYTGGAVDLTIADSKGWLNMGTEFDAFVEEAHSLYYENKVPLMDEERCIRDNRRLLREKMVQAGFHSNPDEWWHYEYGNSRWAKEKNVQPKYMGIELKREEN